MDNFTAPNQPKIDDRKWGSIESNTTPFSIVNFRRFRAGQIVHFILRQFLSQKLPRKIFIILKTAVFRREKWNFQA